MPAAAPAAAAGAGAGAAALPKFVYWTNLEKGSARTPPIFITPLSKFWAEGEVTDLTRADLETAIVENGEALCVGNVSSDYLRDQSGWNRNQLIMMLSEDHIVKRGRGVYDTPSSKGFILARKEGEGMYLDIICTSPGLGSALLDFFHSFAEAKGAKFVKLSSLANVLTYYPKKGYEFRKTCMGAPLAILPESLLTRDPKVKSIPKTTYEAYDDKDYFNFMYETLYKKADLGVRAAEDCKRLHPEPLAGEEYKARDCAQDGYTMLRCIRAPIKKGGAHKTRRTKRHSKSKKTRSGK